jgi:hypothetical protein
MLMSTPATPRSSGNPTREQLDDLDALLQRMLDLPVNRLEEEAGENVVPPMPQPPAEALVTVVESPAVSKPAKHARPAEAAPRSSEHPGANGTPRPMVALDAASSRNVGTKPSANRSQEAPPAPTLALPPEFSQAKPPVASGQWVALGLDSLLALNGAFDRGAERLGTAGRWLQGPRGRTALGVTGLCLIGLALLLLALDWFGWTW